MKEVKDTMNACASGRAQTQTSDAIPVSHSNRNSGLFFLLSEAIFVSLA